MMDSRLRAPTEDHLLLATHQEWNNQLEDRVKFSRLPQTIWRRPMKTSRKKSWRSSRNLLAQLPHQNHPQLTTRHQGHTSRAEKSTKNHSLLRVSAKTLILASSCPAATSSHLLPWALETSKQTMNCLTVSIVQLQLLGLVRTPGQVLLAQEPMEAT